MLEIISGSSVKKLDADFIADRGISSHRLMENAAQAFCGWFEKKYHRNDKVGIFCGHGNNGGDGLAIGRLLWRKGYDIIVFLVGDFDRASADCRLNRELLPDKLPAITMNDEDIKHMEFDLNVVIDAVLGIGVNRPLEGNILHMITKLNGLSEVSKVAVDIPTGLPSDECLKGEAFRADVTVSFQFPKFSLMFPEHAAFVGKLHVVNIGIDRNFLSQFSENKFYLQKKDVVDRHISFSRFSHKGDFGRVLLAGGSYGSMGAIKMSAEAALRTGSGLAACLVPQCGVNIIQIALPEAQVLSAESENNLGKSYPQDSLKRFDAIGVGPGMGTNSDAVSFLKDFFTRYHGPKVIDADAINILAKEKELLNELDENCVLTPHLKEFERLVGACTNHKERLSKSMVFSKKYRCIVVLKGAHTCISFPDGRQFFNSTGNKHMATGGAGDVLTGMITSFLGQGYSVENATLCGVYQHGLAGEIASVYKKRGTIATDIVRAIPKSYLVLKID
ncbi:bifunctional ADP-dependent NAD(P)H-hydrate dehydratase/NAD(P)H-hydrate epimerase [Echinicola strongylocentroti]|uniref:Bifunctional NAD(P)H-hydrate repair enzyme n=1 Tax=Echinicola strongylocentroti TaxID=1795355 RepID=A0A2Z4IGS9_9BACT|nr:NAD(P)H-hydrate dehydratase [Echinicola strongylocentroti]AWW29870.1 bifunctional ADP-dependent NAD(P)H-hydrate dehydratase/NAD(P)H-hydrate epimerase [Echinicola strongylocentroti]